MSDCQLSLSPTTDKHHLDDIFPLLEPEMLIAAGEKNSGDSLASALDHYFCVNPKSPAVQLPRERWNSHIAPSHWLYMFLDDVLTRSQFYQLPATGLCHMPTDRYPALPVQSTKQSGFHPKRPASPKGYVYQRTDPLNGITVSYRLFEPEKDMPRFTRWMNCPRVADFWEQAWSEEALLDYINGRLSDPHTLPLIGEFDGQPFGYIEAYWVSEDRLAPYYDSQPFDRGIHVLVGEEAFRGERYFNMWMRAITHYLFLDDCRTMRVVLEPRHDNTRLFNRIKSVGYKQKFLFDFPHKRAALMMTSRYAFFREQW
ncbi:GNAT family N-acetyltransferase [Grimontia hollisae]|uniref:N(6)-hydroxylysine O-acetyltransferase n=1 Tax=Grimontia hollisae TaxID=673 RepID=A0A377HMY9_GRIHO|nr:GNAT family N-acetyltransferase [Grimontia hollisae]STO57549.1 N(6)-hydroxylysine O-acetyltransferase [Grimontia hollisae]